MRIRYWDIDNPAKSYIVAGAANDPGNQAVVSYRCACAGFSVPQLRTFFADARGARGRRVILTCALSKSVKKACALSTGNPFCTRIQGVHGTLIHKIVGHFSRAHCPTARVGGKCVLPVILSARLCFADLG